MNVTEKLASYKSILKTTANEIIAGITSTESDTRTNEIARLIKKGDFAKHTTPILKLFSIVMDTDLTTLGEDESKIGKIFKGDSKEWLITEKSGNRMVAININGETLVVSTDVTINGTITPTEFVDQANEKALMLLIGALAK